MARHTRVSFILLAALAGALPGCGLFGTRNSGPLVPAANSPITDVPVPAGFTLIADTSTSKIIPGNNLRIVNHNYKGSDDVLPIVNFYQTQLPEKGWKWVDTTGAAGSEYNVHFTRNNEDLMVTVTPARWGGSYIRIKLDPAGRDAQK
jgi:hypothetical protein